MEGSVGVTARLKNCLDKVEEEDTDMLDPLRSIDPPFSADISRANAVLNSNHHKRHEKIRELQNWCSESSGILTEGGTSRKKIASMPCAFGRSEADEYNHLKLFTLLLNEEEVVALSDQSLQEIIQEYRRAWKRLALHGITSAFLISIVGPRLSRMTPGPDLQEICRGLMSMYLMKDIQSDRPYYEEEFIDLKFETSDGPKFKRFGALSNIFCIQGDKRWWRDHRVPGGILISTNSVGHFIHRRKRIMELGNAERDHILQMAKLTIRNAYHDELGEGAKPLPATCLKDESGVESSSVYEGYYHTDHLIPTIYFNPNVSVPTEQLQKYSDLDFTYIWKTDSESYSQLIGGKFVSRGEVASTLLAVPDYKIEENFLADKQRALIKFLEKKVCKSLNKQADSANWNELYLQAGVPDISISKPLQN